MTAGMNANRGTRLGLALVALFTWGGLAAEAVAKSAAARPGKTALTRDMIYACAAEAPAAFRWLAPIRGEADTRVRMVKAASDIVLWDRSMAAWAEEDAAKLARTLQSGRQDVWLAYWVCIQQRHQAQLGGVRLLTGPPSSRPVYRAESASGIDAEVP